MPVPLQTTEMKAYYWKSIQFFQKNFVSHSFLPSSLEYADNGIISFLDTEHFVLQHCPEAIIICHTYGFSLILA